MKNKNSLVKAIKQLLFAAETETEEVYVDSKTEDGKTLRFYPAIEVDAKVKEMQEDGTLADLDSSITSITLDDVIEATEAVEEVVDENGVVTTEAKPAIEAVSATVLTITDSVITAVEATSEDEPKNEEMNKIKFMAPSKVERTKEGTENFAILKEVYTWEIEVDNASVEQGATITYTVDYGNGPETFPLWGGTFQMEDGNWVTLSTEGVVILIVDNEGTVISAPAVGEKVETPVSNDTETAPTTEDDTTEDQEMSVEDKEVFSMLQTLKEENEKLKEDFKKLSQTPSVDPINSKMDFKKEKNTNVDTKQKSMFGRTIGLYE